MRKRRKLKDGCDGTLDAFMYIPQSWYLAIA